MAFDLRAVLRLDDRFSDPMRRAERVTERTQRTMDRLSRTTNTVERSQERLNHSLSKVGRGFSSLKSGILAAAGAYATLQSAQNLFSSTVGNAAQFEQSNVVIGAMFDDKKLAKQYTKMLDKFAADSPVMDSQAMYANSKGFISQTKNVKQLEKMWSLAERMAAIDPAQGVEGAVYALRELFSGDAVSMVERFEMPRQIMNEIKKLPLEQQLSRLDEYFNKIGMTTKLIDEMGGTTLGLWAQVREKFALVLRDMGQPSLEVISGFLTNVLAKLEGGELDRFAQVGARWIEKILTGLTNSAVKLFDWFTALTSSPEWAEKTTLFAKIDFIMNDIYDNFMKWLNNEKGAERIQKVASDITQLLAVGLQGSIEYLTPAAIQIGKALGNGIYSGVLSSLGDSWLLQLINDPNKFIQGKIKGALAKTASDLFVQEFGNKGKSKTPKKEKSHAGGLDYVPYDGYGASLHKGEKVLSRGEARQYRENVSSSGIVITGNTFNVRHDSDIKAVAMELAKLIESEGVRMT